MTKQGKGIALLLVRETPIYVDLHPQRTSRLAKMLNPSSYLRGHSQRNLSKYSAFFPPPPPIIPLQTRYTRARISHIIRVESKSITYHAFSLSFPLALFLPARQGERKQSVSTWNQASSQELTAWNPLPDYLPGIALETRADTSTTLSTAKVSHISRSALYSGGNQKTLQLSSRISLWKVNSSKAKLGDLGDSYYMICIAFDQA
ncbi:hypothetical protein ACFX11_047003 [Malus domestica]